MKNESQAVLVDQTGPEESFLIGTPEQLKEFANAILAAIEKTNEQDFFGVNANVCALERSLLDGKGTVMIDHIVAVKDDETKNEVFYNVYNA